MNGRSFVDTNILLYAYDREAGEKNRQAKIIIQNLWETGDGILSSQVLEEFYVNVTRKIQTPLKRAEAREVIRHYLVWEVIAIDGAMILEASGLEDRSKLSFWDALIVVSAQRGGAVLLLTEDFHHGRRFSDLLIQNPFRQTSL
jgi:predicted nucleic acid-binding protein